MAPSFPRLAHARGHRGRRGSVVLFVLGVIFLTAYMLTRYIDRAGGELLAEAKAASRAPLREEAYAVLETSLGVLASLAATDGGLHAPGQGWQNPLAFTEQSPSPGFAAVVTVEDETGRLSLPRVSEPILQRYLEHLGCSRMDAEHVLDALQVWTKKDYTARTNEADPRQYENAPLPYGPPQRPLRSWEEFRAIRVTRELFFDEAGEWNELGRRFRAGVTLHDCPQVNVNTAPPAVLVALGLDPAAADSVERRRADPHTQPFQRTVAEASGAWGADLTILAAGAEAQCLRIRITVSQGSRVYRLMAVVRPGNAAATPPTPDAAAAGEEGKEDTVAVRSWSRNKIDSPFRILELREDTGP